MEEPGRLQSMGLLRVGHNRDRSIVFESASKYCISDSFVDYDGHSISSKGFLPTVVDIMLNSPIPIHVSLLIPNMLMFTLAISFLTSLGLYNNSLTTTFSLLVAECYE